MVIDQILRKVLPRPLSQPVYDWFFALMPRISCHMLHNWFVGIFVDLLLLLIFKFIQVCSLESILAVFWQSSSSLKNTPRTLIVRIAIQLHGALELTCPHSLHSDYISNVNHVRQAHRLITEELTRHESLSILEFFLGISPIGFLNFLV